MKVKWKVAEVPTGRYRSFDTRGWPTASYEDGSFAGSIYCTSNEAYVPSRVKTGNHAPLKLRIRNFSAPTWTCVISTSEFKTVDEAKAAFDRILKQYPHLTPEGAKVKKEDVK